MLANEQWNGNVSSTIIHNRFLEVGQTIFNSLFPSIPIVHVIPEFRQIRTGEKYTNDGVGLVDLLGRYQSPTIGNDSDRKKFERIQEFIRKLIHLLMHNWTFLERNLN